MKARLHWLWENAYKAFIPLLLVFVVLLALKLALGLVLLLPGAPPNQFCARILEYSAYWLGAGKYRYEGLVVTGVGWFAEAVQGLVLTTIVVWMIWRMRPRRVTPDEAHDRSILDDESALRQYIARVLDSEHFLQALRSTLPKVSDAEDAKLAALPFILEALDQRVTTYRRYSQYALGTTFVLGLLFVAIIVHWGNVLLLDESAGTPLALKETKEAGVSLGMTLQEMGAWQGGRRGTVDSIVKGVEREYQFTFSQDASAIASAANRLGRIEDVPALVALITEETQRRRKTAEWQSRASLACERLSERLTEAKSSVEYAAARLPTVYKAYEAAVDALAARTREREFLVVEILRRVCIGVLVASFLLALLRYTAGLYRSFHSLVLQAQDEYMNVHRFHVAYRCSAADEERGKLLATFASRAGSPTGDEVKLLEIDGVKEILSALARVVEKKLG